MELKEMTTKIDLIDIVQICIPTRPVFRYYGQVRSGRVGSVLRLFYTSGPGRHEKQEEEEGREDPLISVKWRQYYIISRYSPIVAQSDRFVFNSLEEETHFYCILQGEGGEWQLPINHHQQTQIHERRRKLERKRRERRVGGRAVARF